MILNMKGDQMRYYIVALDYETFIRFVNSFGYTPSAATFVDNVQKLRGARRLPVILSDGWESRSDLDELLLELRLGDAMVLEHSTFSKAIISYDKFIPVADFFKKKLAQYEENAKSKLLEENIKPCIGIQKAIFHDMLKGHINGG